MSPAAMAAMGLFDRLRGGDRPTVLFLGIDGVPFGLIADQPATFPTLTALAEDGAAGSIDSIIPPESSACWPALTTGVNPGKTGVYGFQDREVGSYETYVPMGRDVQAERVWNRLEHDGGDATVMNVPVTFPPDRSVDRMVSGFLSPELDRAAHPPAFRDALESMGYRIDVDAKLGHQEDKSAFLEDAHETLEARFEAFHRYIEEGDWDLFFGVFMTTDRVNHFLYEDYERNGEFRDEFLTFYATLDEYIGRLLEAAPDEATCIVASDHGFTTLEKEVHMNAWLESAGWLSYGTASPENLGDIADETRAYSLIPGRFYLNLENREPRGTVPADEYEATRAELKEDLLDLRGPNGESVIARVVEREEVFRGDHESIAPDLVALPTPGFDLKAGFKADSTIFDRGPRTGMHTFDDAALFIDDPSAVVTDANLYDIAPTILDCLAVESDRADFDGASLV